MPMEAGRKAAGYLPDQSARELERCDDRSVDPVRVVDPGGMNPQWPDARSDPRKADSIASEIEKRASPKARNQPHIRRTTRVGTQIHSVKTKIHPDEPQRPNSLLS